MLSESSAASDALQDTTNKGKGRAQDLTERTPLLSGQSSTSVRRIPSPDRSAQSNRRLRSWLTLVFLVSLSICVSVFVLLALLAWSYAARVSRLSPEDVVRDGLVFQGPDRIDVVNITSSGEMWVSIDVRLGVDAGAVMGVNSDQEGASLLGDLWRCLGRWGVRRLDRVSVALSTINITSAADPSTLLASIDVPPTTVPLSVNPPEGSSWLTHVSTLTLVRLNNDTSIWVTFLRNAWQDGSIHVQASVAQAFIHGGAQDEHSWRSRMHQKFRDIDTSIHLTIPSLPGLPHPGPKVPFSSVQDLVTLKSFSVSNEYKRLLIRACASIIDPAPPTFNLTSPSIPFIISLPTTSSSHSLIPVASVSTAPFTLTHPNISLDISGSILPLENNATATLSTFLSRYLSKQSNPILISSPLMPNLSLETMFPAPNPPPRILRNVTIKNMKIKPGTTFLASGTVYARIVLPKGIDVNLVVSRVLPDVLVFDGEVPDFVHWSPTQPSLPDPLPEKAFGHIRPDDWLKSISAPEESDEGEGAVYIVTAEIVEVPLEVLPGRQKEFSNFVSKVVFSSDGAIAGILGSTAVAAKVEGLPFSGPNGEMELSGLPFRGSVRVGKKSMLYLNELHSFVVSQRDNGWGI